MFLVYNVLDYVISIKFSGLLLLLVSPVLLLADETFPSPDACGLTLP